SGRPPGTRSASSDCWPAVTGEPRTAAWRRYTGTQLYSSPLARPGRPRRKERGTMRARVLRHVIILGLVIAAIAGRGAAHCSGIPATRVTPAVTFPFHR